MAGWLEGIEEAAFRPAPGGHIYMAPNPWLFGRSRYYLVTDAQKAVIGPLLRKRAKFGLLIAALTLLIAVPLFFFVMFFAMSGSLPWISPLLFGLGFGLLIMLPLLVIPHIYMMRTLGPIISQLAPTDQRFTFRQQFSNMAAAMPKWMIYCGIGGGVLMMLSALMGIVDVIVSGHGRWIYPMVNMTTGVLVLIFFTYLTNLRKRAAKAQ